MVFFPSTQCDFSQSYTPCAFKRSHHDLRGVEGSQMPQNDIVLRLKAAVVITPFYKEQDLMSTPPLLPHLTFQPAWEQIFKQSAGEQQEEQGSSLLSAWQNVPVARWAQEKAGPSSCWVGGAGKSMAFLKKRTAGLRGKPGPCSALSFISACRQVLHGPPESPVDASALISCEKFYPWVEQWLRCACLRNTFIPSLNGHKLLWLLNQWPLLQWENTIPRRIVLGPTSGFWAVGWKNTTKFAQCWLHTQCQHRSEAWDRKDHHLHTRHKATCRTPTPLQHMAMVSQLPPARKYGGH